MPAIGEGLCVSNVFQTNMVLQRDKPLRVWGWAEAGEEVTVNFAGEQASAKAGKDRTWDVGDPQDGAIQGFAIAGEDRKFHPPTSRMPRRGRTTADEATRPLSRGDRNKIIQVLREQDKARRLKEAQQVIEAKGGTHPPG